MAFADAVLTGLSFTDLESGVALSDDGTAAGAGNGPAWLSTLSLRTRSSRGGSRRPRIEESISAYSRESCARPIRLLELLCGLSWRNWRGRWADHSEISESTGVSNREI